MGEEIRPGLSFRLPHTNNKNIFTIAILTGTFAILVMIVYRILVIFSANAEVAAIDNNFVYAVIRRLGGYELYGNPETSPYAINLYPPLYYNFCTAVARLLHVHTDEPLNVFRVCRAVSLLCDVVTCMFLYRSLRKNLGTQKHLAIMATASLAAIFCHLGYTFSRSDSLMLAFYAGFFYLLTRPSLLQKKINLVTLAIISVACLFSKQNGIILPLLAVSWLWIHNARKSVVMYLLFYAVSLIAVYFVYTGILHYDYLQQNNVRALQNRIDFSWFYTDIFKRMMNSLWVLPVYIALIFSLRAWMKPSGNTVKSLSVIFLVQFTFSLFTSFKWGSGVSYFNESFYLSCFILCLVLNSVSAAFLKTCYVLFLPLFLLFIIHTCAQGYLFFLQNKEQKMADYRQQIEIRNYLRPRLQDNLVFNLGDANASFLKVILFRESAVPNLDMVNCCLLPDHTFDYSMLKKDFFTGHIAYLIKNANDPTESVWGIPLQQYRKDTTIGRFDIYKFHQP